MGGVSPYFSKVSGSGVDVTLLIDLPFLGGFGSFCVFWGVVCFGLGLGGLGDVGPQGLL